MLYGKGSSIQLVWYVVAYNMATTTIAAGSSAIAGSYKSQDTSSIEISYGRGTYSYQVRTHILHVDGFS